VRKAIDLGRPFGASTGPLYGRCFGNSLQRDDLCEHRRLGPLRRALLPQQGVAAELLTVLLREGEDVVDGLIVEILWAVFDRIPLELIVGRDHAALRADFGRECRVLGEENARGGTAEEATVPMRGAA